MEQRTLAQEAKLSDVLPKRNLPVDAEPWGRRIEELVSELQGLVSRVDTNTSTQIRGLNSQTNTTSARWAEHSELMDGMRDELALAAAEVALVAEEVAALETYFAPDGEYTQAMAELEAKLTAAETAVSNIELAMDDMDAQVESAVTDSAAAKAAAKAAQTEATEAKTAATTASGLYTVASANPTAANATGKPLGAVWEVRSGGTTVRRYVLTAATTWTQVKVGQDFIGDGAIGRAQIGQAAVGTAEIADLAVTNGKIGDLDVGKLTVTGPSKFSTAVMQALIADSGFFEQLYSNNVVVAGENLLPDPLMKNPRAWRNDYRVYTTGGRTGGGSILIPASTSQSGVYNASNVAADMPYAVKVTPGQRYNLSVWFTSAVAGVGTTNKVSIYDRFFDANGSVISSGAIANAVTFSADTWTSLSGVSREAPDNAVYMAVGFFVQSAHNSEVRFSDPSVRSMTDGNLLVDGSITTRHVTAKSITSAEIASNTITASNIAARTITSTEIVSGTITGNEIAANAITAVKIAAGEITTVKLASGAVTADKLTVDTALVNKLVAGNVWAGDVTAKKISGSEIIGSVFTTSAAGSASRTYMDTNGLTVYADGADQVKIGHGIETGMAVRQPGGSMVPLGRTVFGSQQNLVPQVSSYLIPPGTAAQWSTKILGLYGAKINITPWASNLKVTVGYTHGFAFLVGEAPYRGEWTWEVLHAFHMNGTDYEPATKPEGWPNSWMSGRFMTGHNMYSGNVPAEESRIRTENLTFIIPVTPNVPITLQSRFQATIRTATRLTSANRFVLANSFMSVEQIQ